MPTGVISFEPDTSKGNSGPRGYSSIVDGKYQTDKLGKGAMTGPLRIKITGYPEPETPGDFVDNPLFPAYSTTIDLKSDITTLDFEVPKL